MICIWAQRLCRLSQRSSDQPKKSNEYKGLSNTVHYSCLVQIESESTFTVIPTDVLRIDIAYSKAVKILIILMNIQTVECRAKPNMIIIMNDIQMAALAQISVEETFLCD